MSDIAGYTYQADTWCEDCIENLAPNGSLYQWAEREGIDFDDPYSYDSDNFPKVILTDSEAGDTPDHCCKCGVLLNTSWAGDTVEYAVAALEEYVIAAVTGNAKPGNPEVLDKWSDRLSGCMVDDHDQWMIDLYDRTREYEDEAD